MATVTLKGNVVNLRGDIPAENSIAPDFSFVRDDLSEGKLSEYSGKVKVLLSVPSLDTGVCAIETRTFNQKLASRDVVGIVISKDLPFAMKRFCETENIENVSNASDYRYGDFGINYNVEQVDGPLKGLLARAVWVVDGNDNIFYTELVPEITTEPDYDKVMEVLDSLSLQKI